MSQNQQTFVVEPLVRATIDTLPAAPALLALARFRYAPKAKFGPAAGPGPVAFLVESGSLMFSADGPVSIRRSATGRRLELPPPRQEFTVVPGDEVLIPGNVVHAVRNTGSTPATILGAATFPGGAPPKNFPDGVTFQPLVMSMVPTLAWAPAEYSLQRVTFSPGSRESNTYYSGPGLLYVENGTLNLQNMAGDAQLVQDQARGQTQAVKAGGQAQVSQGQGVIMPAGGIATLGNDSSQPATVLSLRTGPAFSQPTTDLSQRPVSGPGPVPPPPPADLSLRTGLGQGQGFQPPTPDLSPRPVPVPLPGPVPVPLPVLPPPTTDIKQILPNFVHAVMDGQNPKAVAQFLAPGFNSHDLPAASTDLLPKDGDFGVASFLSAQIFPSFSNFQTKYAALISEGDLAAGHWVQTFLHSGDGYFGTKATGTQVTIQGFTIVRVKDGQMIEHWEERDQPTWHRMIGLGFPLGPLESGPVLATATLGPASVTATLGAVSVTDPNKRPVANYYSAWNTGDLAVLDKVLTPNFSNNTMIAGQSGGIAGIAQFMGVLRNALGGFQVTVDLIISDGSGTVFSRVRYSGRQQATLFGVPATGRAVEFGGIDQFTVQNGLIVARSGLIDEVALAMQMGVLQPPVVFTAGGPQFTAPDSQFAAGGSQFQPSGPSFPPRT